MRILLALLVLFAGFVGYGTYRQRQITIAQEARAAELKDSLRRVDSLQRVAEAEAAAARQAAARRAAGEAARAAAQQYVRYESDAPKPLKLPKPQRRVYIIDKPIPTNRRP